MEFIPYIGPIIGPIPPVLVALFTEPDQRALGGAAVRRAAAARGPRRRAAGVPHLAADQPDPVILSLLIGYQLYGIAGALVALPVATVIRQTVALPAPPPGARAVGCASAARRGRRAARRDAALGPNAVAELVDAPSRG